MKSCDLSSLLFKIRNYSPLYSKPTKINYWFLNHFKGFCSNGSFWQIKIIGLPTQFPSISGHIAPNVELCHGATPLHKAPRERQSVHKADLPGS